MTPPHPRDPRHRRRDSFAPVDPLAAAVRLEMAMDAMRADSIAHGPDLATAAQMGTTEPPITARQFAAALEQEPVASSPGPAPVAPVFPAPPAPVTPPGAFSAERSFTWRSRHDVRSLSFGVADRLAGRAPLQDKMWPVGPVLDQGAEGQCVGCAVAAAGNILERIDPMAVRLGGYLDLDDATMIYKRAQVLDNIPGEDYAGTSVLAGMQAGVEANLFGGYLWAFGTRQVAQAVLQRGPVIVGVPWSSGMYETGPGGLVVLAGEPVGGHCLTVVGLRMRGPQGQPGPFFVWQNSWGTGYGDGGLGYVHHKDLAVLLRGVGEAAVPTVAAQS